MTGWSHTRQIGRIELRLRIAKQRKRGISGGFGLSRRGLMIVLHGPWHTYWLQATTPISAPKPSKETIHPC